MSEEAWENEGGSIELTPEAVEAIKQIEDFYKQGYTIEQIADYFGFAEEDGDKTIHIRLLMAVANKTGMLD